MPMPQIGLHECAYTLYDEPGVQVGAIIVQDIWFFKNSKFWDIVDFVMRPQELYRCLLCHRCVYVTADCRPVFLMEIAAPGGRSWLSAKVGN